MEERRPLISRAGRLAARRLHNISMSRRGFVSTALFFFLVIFVFFFLFYLLPHWLSFEMLNPAPAVFHVKQHKGVVQLKFEKKKVSSISSAAAISYSCTVVDEFVDAYFCMIRFYY